jgi:two-component system response regulator RegA
MSDVTNTANQEPIVNHRLLIIEDDESFAAALARRLERHDYSVEVAHSTEDGLKLAEKISPNYVLLDMKVGNNNGIHILPQLRQLLPNSRIVLLTGYASIATAVESIKSGADDYLSKPIDGASLLAALQDSSKNDSKEGAKTRDTLATSMSPARMEWEHIQQVLKMNQGNISETARQLGMHRRTLQRKLGKRPQAS